jgi:hypothetical protein
MNILLPKLFIQTLAQAPHPKFSRAEQTGGRIPSQRRGRPSKNQGSFLPRPFNAFVSAGEFVLLKVEDNGFRKRERADYVRID